MSDAERLPYSLELPAAAPVRIGDLPGMMAGAMHTDEFARVVAEDGIWRELRAMVDAGTLQPLNALTMLPHEFPVGDGLRRAVLLPFSIRPMLQAQGIELRLIEPGNGPDLWSLANAARDVGEIQGWSKRQAETLCEQMLCAARDGALVVRNPHTDLPVPLHKRATVRDFYELVTRDDVNVWLMSIRAPYRWVSYDEAAAEPRYIAGRRLWKLPEAIETIAAMPGFGVSADGLKARVQRDAEQQKLTLRDMEHGAEIKSDWGAVVLGWCLYAEDFNAWLESAGFREPYRLADDPPSESSQPGPVAPAEPAPNADDVAAPLPLTTGDVAFCFDGLRYSEAKWKKPLGDKPKWLAACVAIPGRRGVSETRWNPVLIGAALVHAGHAPARSVRARFQSRPMLIPWLDAWKTYEADHIDSA